MTARLDAVSFDARDPRRLARFWSELLGWDTAADRHGPLLLPGDDIGFRLRFRTTRLTSDARNRMHLDLTSTTLAVQELTVARALALGARHVDVGQRPDEPHVVLADPEGNDFCVIEPGNAFLADCGSVGALACDGTREVGLFWSEALGWPLVWDRDQETAIRSPRGGPKISWGGRPVMPQSGGDRLHLDLVTAPHGDWRTEVDRLLALGAGLVHAAPGPGGEVVMTDPDGTVFRVLAAL